MDFAATKANHTLDHPGALAREPPNKPLDRVLTRKAQMLRALPAGDAIEQSQRAILRDLFRGSLGAAVLRKT